MRQLLVPRVGKAWETQARDAIAELTEGHRVVVRPIGVPISQRGSYTPEQIDLVTLRFDFAQRDEVVICRVQRIYAVNLLEVLLDVPRGLVVGYGGAGYTASYRSKAFQTELYERYEAGVGGKAAPPGNSYHERGLATDSPPTAQGRARMRRQGFFDGSSFGDPSHWTWGAVG